MTLEALQIEQVLSSTGFGDESDEAVAAFLVSDRSPEAVRQLVASLEEMYTNLKESWDEDETETTEGE